MHTVKVHFVGANLYVPHTDSKKLMVVLPNATRLGQSPDQVADGSRPSTHWPVLFEQRSVDGKTHISFPNHFLGSRLTFDFGTSPAEPDLTAIETKSKKGWLHADPSVLSATPGDFVAAQVLVETGTVSPYRLAGPCSVAWSSSAFEQSLEPVIRGLTLKVRVEDEAEFVATADRWMEDPDTGGSMGTKQVFSRKISEDAIFYVGNFCAEDILRWEHSSNAGRAMDHDFRWIYKMIDLSQNKPIAKHLGTYHELPTPEVDGSSIFKTTPVEHAFVSVWKGGGTVGCECEGLLDQAQDF
ncbi:MAG: hypothetical protein AAF481_17465 [Acidobacteriota bacterium]